MQMTLNDGTDYQIPDKDITMWIELYPAVNVEQELRGMIGWLDANPKKRKTRKGIKRFINSWLSRAQDSGGRSPYAKPSDAPSGGPTPTKQMTANDELCDISWVPAGQRDVMRKRFMEKYGHVFEG
jgi:hypothetical protein